MNTEARDDVVSVMHRDHAAHRYDVIVDSALQTLKGVRPEDVVTQRARGHELLAVLAEYSIDVIGVEMETRGAILFTLRRGIIVQYPGLDGFKVIGLSKGGSHLPIPGNPETDPRDVLKRYLEEGVAEATIADKLEDEEARRRQERTDELRAGDDRIIAAYESLPAEMRDGFRAMLEYLALSERRSAAGFHMGGPPVANMLLRTLDRTERSGMPEFNERAGTSFRW
jgi:hypothetical protein